MRSVVCVTRPASTWVSDRASGSLDRSRVKYLISLQGLVELPLHSLVWISLAGQLWIPLGSAEHPSRSVVPWD